MIKSIDLPTFIVKEPLTRSKKESGGFTWVVFIEDKDSRSYVAFQKALGFMHEDDKVIGYSIVDNKEDTKHDLVEDFKAMCYKSDIKNHEFKLLEKTTESIGKQMTDIANGEGEKTVVADFTVIGHNLKKYIDLEHSAIVDVVKGVKNNIFYYSCQQ